jgi:hypothetical protein
MSFRPGSLAQPDSVVMDLVFKVAPQRGQLNCAASTMAPHQLQLVCFPAAGGTLLDGRVMDD